MQISFVSKREITHTVWEFRFLPDTVVQYTPGQYAHFRLPALAHERDRAFSLTSHPSEPEIRFITRFATPLSAYKAALASLHHGDTLHIDEPMGDCILPRLANIPVVFIAQGIAIASYLSMLTECARSNLEHRITLLWARRSEDDPLKNLIPGEIPHFKQIDIHYPQRIKADDILPHVFANSLVYLSGSQSFVEQLGRNLEAVGISRQHLIYEYYDGYHTL